MTTEQVDALIAEAELAKTEDSCGEWPLFHQLVAALREMREDAARLDAIEAFIAERGGIVLHDGMHTAHYPYPFPGLGTVKMGRTLREAVDASLRAALDAARGAQETT